MCTYPPCWVFQGAEINERVKVPGFDYDYGSTSPITSLSIAFQWTVYMQY